jgi:hypothetical protein
MGPGENRPAWAKLPILQLAFLTHEQQTLSVTRNSLLLRPTKEQGIVAASAGPKETSNHLLSQPLNTSSALL